FSHDDGKDGRDYRNRGVGGNQSLSRLYIPDGLDEYAYLNKQDATTAVRRIVLPMARDSPFGRLSTEALVLFRKKNG
ncbi:hypothetical protein JG688_00015054, partial [Phytophthora aleatoria]